MSVRCRAIRLIALVAPRYGTGSGSDRVTGAWVATAPGTVPERSFPYIQLKTALNIGNSLKAEGIVRLFELVVYGEMDRVSMILK